jgi:hypothetical protein
MFELYMMRGSNFSEGDTVEFEGQDVVYKLIAPGALEVGHSLMRVA